MREIGAFAAKTHLSQLLNSVCLGETFAITKHGKIIAFLIPPAEINPKLDVSLAIAGITALRKKVARQGKKLTLKEIKQMKETGKK